MGTKTSLKNVFSHIFTYFLKSIFFLHLKIFLPEREEFCYNCKFNKKEIDKSIFIMYNIFIYEK